jgi:hypothetical protein
MYLGLLIRVPDLCLLHYPELLHYSDKIRFHFWIRIQIQLRYLFQVRNWFVIRTSFVIRIQDPPPPPFPSSISTGSGPITNVDVLWCRPIIGCMQGKCARITCHRQIPVRFYRIQIKTSKQFQRSRLKLCELDYHNS